MLPRKFQLPVTALFFFFLILPSWPNFCFSPRRPFLPPAAAGPWWPRRVFQRRPHHGAGPSGAVLVVSRAARRNGPFPGAAISPTVLDSALRTAASPLCPRRVEEPSPELPAARLPRNKLVRDLSFDAFARACPRLPVNQVVMCFRGPGLCFAACHPHVPHPKPRAHVPWVHRGRPCSPGHSSALPGGEGSPRYRGEVPKNRVQPFLLRVGSRCSEPPAVTPRALVSPESGRRWHGCPRPLCARRGRGGCVSATEIFSSLGICNNKYSNLPLQLFVTSSSSLCSFC